METNKQKVVIFDFDGTLADVAWLLRELYQEMATQKKWPVLTEQEYKRLRHGSLKEAMRWVGLKPWQLPGLLRVGRSQFYRRSEEIKLFKGVPELIRNLHDQGWRIYILSSNSGPTIHKILHAHGMDKLVHVLKRPPFFGKANSIRKLVKVQKYDKANVWVVGDEHRDMQAAQKAGVNSIAVSWGLQDVDVLKSANPTFIANKPNDIEKILIKR